LLAAWLEGRMRKTIALILAATMTILLAACSNNSELKSEGITPYELTDREKRLLQSFDLENNSQIIEFNAPQKAISLNVNIYRLNSDGEWDNTDEGGISIGIDREPVKVITGFFTMKLNKDYTIDFVINSNGGKASYKTKGFTVEPNITASAIDFLDEFQEIKINEEMPVALMIYDSGTSLRSYSVQDYFEPSKFEGMDLVQAVTLSFSDK
jgi:hypothetical protein